MKLEVSEVFTVSGMKDGFPTLAAAMAEIDKVNKVGSFTVSHAMLVVASGAGIVPGQPATGTPANKLTDNTTVVGKTAAGSSPPPK